MTSGEENFVKKGHVASRATLYGRVLAVWHLRGADTRVNKPRIERESGSIKKETHDGCTAGCRECHKHRKWKQYNDPQSAWKRTSSCLTLSRSKSASFLGFSELGTVTARNVDNTLDKSLTHFPFCLAFFTRVGLMSTSLVNHMLRLVSKVYSFFKVGCPLQNLIHWPPERIVL